MKCIDVHGHMHGSRNLAILAAKIAWKKAVSIIKGNELVQHYLE